MGSEWILDRLAAGGVVQLAQDRDWWRAVVNAVMNLKVLAPRSLLRPRPRRRWEDGIRMDLREIGLGMWTGFNWLRIGTGGELLLMW
jgi:hypothetical protein